MNLNATIFFQMTVFFILGWIITKFIWPPLIQAIEERRQQIADGLAAAEKSQNDLTQAQIRINKMEESARLEASTHMAETRRQAALIIEQSRHLAEAEYARITAEANKEAIQKAQHLRETLRDEVAVLAVKGAEQILRREINTRDHDKLLNRLKSQL